MGRRLFLFLYIVIFYGYYEKYELDFKKES